MGWFWQQSDTLQLVDNFVGKNDLPGLPVYKTHTYFSQDALYLLCTNGLPMVVLDGTHHFVAGVALPGSAKVIAHRVYCACIHALWDSPDFQSSGNLAETPVSIKL